MKSTLHIFSPIIDSQQVSVIIIIITKALLSLYLTNVFYLWETYEQRQSSLFFKKTLFEPQTAVAS